MIPAVLPIVTGLLSHDQEIVRKKAIMLLQRFLALQPDSVGHLGDKFRAALCDRDPSVMGASLHVFYDLVKADPRWVGVRGGGFRDLVKAGLRCGCVRGRPAPFLHPPPLPRAAPTRTSSRPSSRFSSRSRTTACRASLTTTACPRLGSR